MSYNPKPLGTLQADIVHAVAVFVQSLLVIKLVFIPNASAVQALTPTVIRVPGNFIQIAITCPGASSSRRVLPLGLRRQPPAAQLQ